MNYDEEKARNVRIQHTNFRYYLGNLDNLREQMADLTEHTVAARIQYDTAVSARDAMLPPLLEALEDVEWEVNVHRANLAFFPPPPSGPLERWGRRGFDRGAFTSFPLPGGPDHTVRMAVDCLEVAKHLRAEKQLDEAQAAVEVAEDDFREVMWELSRVKADLVVQYKTSCRPALALLAEALLALLPPGRDPADSDCPGFGHEMDALLDDASTDVNQMYDAIDEAHMLSEPTHRWRGDEVMYYVDERMRILGRLVRRMRLGLGRSPWTDFELGDDEVEELRNSSGFED